MTTLTTGSTPKEAAPKRIRYVPAVGPRLRKLLYVVFGFFALLSANGAYLATVSLFEWLQGQTFQNYFYQIMFLMHLVLGVLMILPVVVFGALHIKNAHNRKNRRAVRVGYGLFTVSLLLIASGIVLMRLEVFGIRIDVRNPQVRSVAYWAHVITPLLAIWLFILHRLAGKRIGIPVRSISSRHCRVRPRATSFRRAR